MSENLRKACDALRQGKIVLLLDAMDRENEGDLIVAAEHITEKSMNFLIQHGSGIVCLSLSQSKIVSLGLPMMAPENTNLYQTAFTVSIEARHGITSGVSAKDRAHTVRVAMADAAHMHDLAIPGHVFPLAAKDGGVFDRLGHTEGSIDLMKMANLKPGAVLCELMNDDGSMTTGDARIRFAQQYSLPIISIEELLLHRLAHENIFIKKTNVIMTQFGQLMWHNFVFLQQISIDIFTRPTTHHAEETWRVAVVDGLNVKNRFIRTVLSPDHDDAFIDAILRLANNKLDAVFLTSHEGAKAPYTSSIFLRGVLTRCRRELGMQNYPEMTMT